MKITELYKKEKIKLGKRLKSDEVSGIELYKKGETKYLVVPLNKTETKLKYIVVELLGTEKEDDDVKLLIKGKESKYVKIKEDRAVSQSIGEEEALQLLNESELYN